jgi:hypothetical protein
MVRHSSLAFALLVATGLGSTMIAGCGVRSGGCERDTDCKGDRVCVKGECITEAKKEPVEPAKQHGIAPATATPLPQPAAAPVPTTPPDQLAADGLPVEIPTPGSTPPSVAEWNAVTREITVRGSSRLNCETKMLREWLRVDCHKNHKGEPADVVHTKQSGQQAFKFVGNGKASIVVQVVRGKEYRAQYTWDLGGAHTGAELIVNWTGGMPRPQITLTEN